MSRSAKTPLIAAALLVLTALGAQAAPLVVQLKGPALAESAGYILAQARGYYAEEGLQVVLHPAPQGPPLESLARGDADIAVEWLPTALLARENGLPLVHIAQIFAKPALRLTCLREAGIRSAADLRGKTLGSWFGGAELPLTGWLNRLQLRADDSLQGVSLLAQWPEDEMLRQKQATCISTLSYDPSPLPQTVTLDPADNGAAVLEDGLYVLRATLSAPGAQDQLSAFLRASMKGWHSATSDPKAAAALLLGPDPDPGALQRQEAQIRAITPLLSPNGVMDEASYRRSLDTLLAGPAPVLKRQPEGGFIHALNSQTEASRAQARP